MEISDGGDTQSTVAALRNTVNGIWESMTNVRKIPSDTTSFP